jgi:hypothetical protein
MPDKRLHLKFDDYLIDHGIVSDRDYSIVHDRMDRDIQIYGHWNHRYEDYYHDIDGIRDWIRKWSHLGYQETLTYYVRVALGHLVLDEMWSKYEYENEYELIKSAYRSYSQRGFSRCYFREK